jgi:hypothetical protein
MIKKPITDFDEALEQALIGIIRHMTEKGASSLLTSSYPVNKDGSLPAEKVPFLTISVTLMTMEEIKAVQRLLDLNLGIELKGTHHINPDKIH